MALLVRKVSRAKWNEGRFGNLSEVPADAITSCLRTTKNTLSWWQIDVTDELEKAVLAIAATAERAETIHVIVINEKELTRMGLELRQSSSNTPLVAFQERHHDLVELTYESLGEVAWVVAGAFRVKQVETYSRADLKQMIRDAVNSGTIAKESLKDRMCEDVWG